MPPVRALAVDGGVSRAVALCLAAVLAWSCHRDKKQAAPAGAASSQPGRLTPELAQKVLARVGDTNITLGDYAATLERMGRFERLRYQSPERRRLLLDEIIEVELLAQEARRRGLDQRPEYQELVRQMLRDELLERVRAELPVPNQIPESEVRAYYDAHRAEFREPERRRVSHILMKDRAGAGAVLEKARRATPTEWGRLVQAHSLDKEPPASPTAPLELAGDLGIVSLVGAGEAGENPRVPVPVQRAVFKLERLGDVYPELVEVDGKFHILRLTGKTEARDRTFAEAERSIRVAAAQARIREREQKLEAELRQRFSVTIDENALKKVTVLAPSRSQP
ncbi:MAG TPA: peptidyl-prolyl cis-trans isomerase [Polyangiaceae bacterium]|jgi:parvulin-like peptidyl-prolyl isomerase